jgi:7,8-dihydropterin-6-yl-methyl-4-(beta-D-ribofuranosyl)aminobenzene 5'-phosphate synthase
LIRTDSGTFLFDTGSGETLLNNLDSLGIDANQIDAVILSHGHSDHCGGLLPLLEKIGARPVYSHSQVFDERFWQGQHEERDISLPHTQAELESAGATFNFLDSFAVLAPGIYFSGVVPRLDPLEKGDSHLVSRAPGGQGWQADEFADDAALAIETQKGHVILLGCAHSGLINTVEHFRHELDIHRIHAIVGGTHLGPASDEQFDATVDYLKQLDFDRLGVSHCTGQIRSAQLYAHFPNKVFFANVGSTLKV